jgi:hypothetical protein
MKSNRKHYRVDDPQDRPNPLYFDRIAGQTLHRSRKVVKNVYGEAVRKLYSRCSAAGITPPTIAQARSALVPARCVVLGGCLGDQAVQVALEARGTGAIGGVRGRGELEGVDSS